MNMNLVNVTAEAAANVLHQCANHNHVETLGPWRWRCSVGNHRSLPLTASLEEGFLQLASHSPLLRTRFGALECALVANQSLAGNVRFALDARQDLHLRTEIVLLEEQMDLLGRVQQALDGFHQGYSYETSPKRNNGGSEPESMAAVAGVVERLREASWVCTEGKSGDFRVQLDGDSAPLARITQNEHGLAVSVELVRAPMEARVPRHALAIFLLTATGAVRLVRANAVEAEGRQCFALEVGLLGAPAAEEADHAMAALSTAYRMCAREANVLLDEAAARCYLSLRDFSITNNSTEKENAPWQEPKSQPKSRWRSAISPGKKCSRSTMPTAMQR